MERVLRLGVRTGVLLVFLMPLVVITNTLFPFIVGKALYTRALIELITGLWLVLALRYPGYRPRSSWLILAFGIYLAVALLAGVTGVSLERSLWSTYERMQGIVDLVHWFLFLIVVTSVFRSSNDWKVLLNANLGASVVMALLGLAQRYDVAVPMYGFMQSSARLDVTLGNATYVGAYLMVNVLVAAGFLAQSYVFAPRPKAAPAMQRRRRRRQARADAGVTPVTWWRLFWVVAIALDLWVLILSGTRGSSIGLAAGLAAFAVGYVVWGRRRALRLSALSILGAAAMAVLLFVYARDSAFVERASSSSLLIKRITEISLNDPSTRGRLASISAGLEGFADRPILGWGPENYVVPFGRYFDADAAVTETFDQAHDKPVEELTTKGALGFVSYMALWGLMLWIVSRRLSRRLASEQLLILFIGSALTGYFVQNLFLFDAPATILQFMLLLAFVVYLEATLEKRAAQPAGKLRQSGRLRPEGAADANPAEPRSLSAWWEAWWGRVSASSARALGTEAAPLAGLMAVLALVALSVYYLNLRPYMAAVAVVKTANPAITWDQRLAHFRDSIDSFPPLANYPRLILIGQVAANWERMDEAEARAAMAMIETEAWRALESEPQGWRIHVALSQVYQKAVVLDPANGERARAYFYRAYQLAPESNEVSQLRAQRQPLIRDERLP